MIEDRLEARLGGEIELGGHGADPLRPDPDLLGRLFPRNVEGFAALTRYAGRDFRLTDVHGTVVGKLIA